MDEGGLFPSLNSHGKGRKNPDKKEAQTPNLGHVGMSHCWWLLDKTVGQDEQNS